MKARWSISTAAAVLLVVLAVVAAPAGEHRDLHADWNDGAIAWRSFDDGLAEAARDGRPVFLLVHTTWCSDCKLFSKVFHDPRVVERSKQFVMVRVDQDREPEPASRFAPDGRYIPRTFFLRSNGELLERIHSDRDEAIYNYPEDQPDALLGAMSKALAALDRPVKVPSTSSTI